MAPQAEKLWKRLLRACGIPCLPEISKLDCNRRQAVDQLLLISQSAGLLAHGLFGELVARADQFAGAHAAGEPARGVKGEGVEFETLFGVAGSGGVGNIVLGGFEHPAVGFQGAGGGGERASRFDMTITREGRCGCRALAGRIRRFRYSLRSWRRGVGAS